MTASRKLLALGAAASLLFTAASCAQSDRDDDNPGTDAGADYKDTITFGAAGAPKLFDPFYATDGETFRVTRQIHESLIDFEEGTSNPAPGLATEWKGSEDGKTWTFTLREGVKFHDGTDFNAEAVCKNFERMFGQTEVGQNPAVSGYWADTMGGFKDQKGEDGKPVESLYESCTVTDPTHVDIKITRATSKFPVLLSLNSFAMQSPTAMEKYKANDVQAAGESFTFPEYGTKQPVGTGAYKFVSYDAANGLVKLEAFDGYWGDKAKTKNLVFKVVKEESTRQQALEKGDLDGYDLPTPAQWPQLKSKGMNVSVRGPFNILYLGLNPKANPALKDLKVRQALYHAINRDELVKQLLPEGATAATQFMPDTVAGYTKDLQPYAYDKQKAMDLLKEAGQENLTIQLWYPSEVVRPYMPDAQAIYDKIKTDWQAAGITVEPVTKPWNGGYLEQVDAGKASAFLLGWTGDYNSADNFIGTFFTNPDNRFGTSEYDWGNTLSEELVAADGTVDEGERDGAYVELNKKLVEEYLPALPISHSPPALVVSPKVEGLTPSPLTAENFATVTVKK